MAPTSYHIFKIPEILNVKNKTTKFRLSFVYFDGKGSLPEQAGKSRDHRGDDRMETLGRYPSVCIRALGFAGGQGHAMDTAKILHIGNI